MPEAFHATTAAQKWSSSKSFRSVCRLPYWPHSYKRSERMCVSGQPLLCTPQKAMQQLLWSMSRKSYVLRPELTFAKRHALQYVFGAAHCKAESPCRICSIASYLHKNRTMCMLLLMTVHSTSIWDRLWCLGLTAAGDGNDDEWLSRRARSVKSAKERWQMRIAPSLLGLKISERTYISCTVSAVIYVCTGNSA